LNIDRATKGTRLYPTVGRPFVIVIAGCAYIMVITVKNVFCTFLNWLNKFSGRKLIMVYFAVLMRFLDSYLFIRTSL
jgi:hypothetical protein